MAEGSARCTSGGAAGRRGLEGPTLSIPRARAAWVWILNLTLLVFLITATAIIHSPVSQSHRFCFQAESRAQGGDLF